MATTEQQNILDASAVNIRVAAAQVSRRYQRFTSYADLYQEACSVGCAPPWRGHRKAIGRQAWFHPFDWANR